MVLAAPVTATAAPPAIVGQPVVGSTLSCVPNKTAPDGLVLSIRWDGFQFQSHAPELTLDDRHVLDLVICSVSVVNPATGTELSREFSPPVIVSGLPSANASPPTVAGTARVGQRVRCNPGEWTHGVNSFAFAWTRDGVDIGSTKATYKLRESDSGHTIGCSARGTNQWGTGEVATSAPIQVRKAKKTTKKKKK